MVRELSLVWRFWIRLDFYYNMVASVCQISLTSLEHPSSGCLVTTMVCHFTFNKPLVQIYQVDWCFICDGIKLLIFTSFFSLILCFFLGFYHRDFWGRVPILCCVDIHGICVKLFLTWLKLPNLVNIETCVFGAPISSNTEVWGGKFDSLFSSMSSTGIFYVFALVFLVFAKILIGLEDTNPRPTLEGLIVYLYCFNFFWVSLRACIFSHVVSRLSSPSCDDEVKSYPILANNL